MKKNMLNYIIENTCNNDYIVSIETDLKRGKLVKDELKIEDVNKFANYLHHQNIKNPRLGLLLDNSNNFVKAFYGIILNNKIPVAINNAIKKEELDDIISKNSLDVIITSNKFIEVVNDSIIEKSINLDEIDISLESSLLECAYVEKDNEDIFVISYTSGTSGNFSKGVELTFSNITFVSEEYKKVYNLTKDSKIITVLPLWHNYAMFACFTSSIVSQSTLIIMKKWDSELFLEINKKFKPDVFPGSPYMYIDLINNYSDKLIELSNLRVCDSGGDSLPIECINRFENATGAVITEGYGLTETSSLTHFNYSASERRVGSLGKTVSNTDCKILDFDGNQVPNGQWGLLWIKGPMVFKDYVGLPGKSDEVKKNGWFNTNDVVKKDDDGFYYIAGRLSDLKDLNGDDNQLRNLENELYKFEGMSRLHIKVNYNTMAQFYYFDIFAILKSGYVIQDLYDYINLYLKSYVVGEVMVVDELPVTGTGKIKRNEIDNIISFDKKKYKSKKLSGGLRCKTLLLYNGEDKKIYQEYSNGTEYQAQKKYNIVKMIKQNNRDALIQNVFQWGKDEKKTWLLSEYKKGKMLSDVYKNNDFAIKKIAKDIAKTLNVIHSFHNEKFGWITDTGVKEYPKLSAYLESELIRFSDAVSMKMVQTDYRQMIKVATNAIKEVKKMDEYLQPELIWFDLNPNNIIVDKKNNNYVLSAIIDAGGAKYGVKEWDLAFIKMEVCQNADEFYEILNEYKKINSDIKEELIDILSIFVELDDMIIRILDGEHLPIPYDTNFKEIINNLYS